MSSGHFLPVDRECPLYFIMNKLTRTVVHVSIDNSERCDINNSLMSNFVWIYYIGNEE